MKTTEPTPHTQEIPAMVKAALASPKVVEAAAELAAATQDAGELEDVQRNGQERIREANNRLRELRTVYDRQILRREPTAEAEAEIKRCESEIESLWRSIEEADRTLRRRQDHRHFLAERYCEKIIAAIREQPAFQEAQASFNVLLESAAFWLVEWKELIHEALRAEGIVIDSSLVPRFFLMDGETFAAMRRNLTVNPYYHGTMPQNQRVLHGLKQRLHGLLRQESKRFYQSQS